jgi:hypothetical protein
MLVVVEPDEPGDRERLALRVQRAELEAIVMRA